MVVHQGLDWSVLGLCFAVIAATFAALWALSAAVFVDRPQQAPRSDEPQ